MYFFKNGLINRVIDRNLETWSHLLNSGEFVHEKYLNKIDKTIFKNMEKQFKEIEIYNLLELEAKGFKLGLWQKLCIWFSGLKPLWLSYKKDMLAMAEAERGDNESGAIEQKDPHAFALDDEIVQQKSTNDS